MLYSEYENSIGTGQVHIWFARPATGWTASIRVFGRMPGGRSLETLGRQDVVPSRIWRVFRSLWKSRA